jgi:hypothetical protein
MWEPIAVIVCATDRPKQLAYSQLFALNHMDLSEVGQNQEKSGFELNDDPSSPTPDRILVVPGLEYLALGWRIDPGAFRYTKLDSKMERVPRLHIVSVP